MNEQTALTELANQARDAYLDWLDASIQNSKGKSAKRRRVNNTLDKIATVLDTDRTEAEKWLLRNV